MPKLGNAFRGSTRHMIKGKAVKRGVDKKQKQQTTTWGGGGSVKAKAGPKPSPLVEMFC